MKALIDKRAALIREADAIVSAATAENRELHAEETERVTALTAQAREVGEEIGRAQAAADARAALASIRTDLSKPQPRRAPELDGAAGSPLVAREAWRDDPARGYRDPKAFLLDVMRSETTGRISDRLASLRAPVQAAAGSDEQGAYDNAYGGFLVPASWYGNLLSLPAPSSPIGATQGVPMTTPVVNIPARVDKNHATSVSGGLRVYRRAETADFTPSRMQFESVKMEATSLIGMAYATEEILSDSALAFMALLETGFRDEFAATRAQEFLFGDGVAKPLGAFHASNAAIVTVSKESGPQTADTIVYANVVKMRARCWGYENAVWIANYDTIPQLMQMNVANTAIVWAPSARDGEPDRLLGRPIIFTEFAKTLGDLNDIVLVNWSQYLEGTLQPLQSAESVHVRFVAHERAFKFWLRNTGMPWWRSALTPKNGSTLSPFVNLEAR